MSAVGRLPMVGDAVTVDVYTLIVDRIEGRRVAKVRVVPTELA